MVITRTPFRISFFGGGTDYPVWYEKNGGAVLNVSINKYCYVTTRYLPPFFDCNYRIRYSKQEETKTIDEIDHPSVRECLRFMNFSDGVEMQHNTDVPGMSGLGSSSAFTVGFLHSLYALRGKEADKRTLALDAIHVEQNQIRENVGSQDQTVAAFGGFNRIEFGGPEKIAVRPVRCNSFLANELDKRLMLFFLGYPRNASHVAAEQIRNTPQKEKELMRMREMVDEAERILSRNAEGINDFGKLLHEGWLLKRSLSSKITNPFIDETYARARDAGAIGGKLIGAGGGGCMLLFVPPENQARVRECLRHCVHIPFAFENTGSQVIYKMPDEI